MRTLELPHLRPMLDRVRTALFNIIRGELEGAKVLDLFSGCGALGIEALSRGASSCVFVEKDAALARLIAQNLEKCRMTDRSRILQADFFSLSRRVPPAGMLPAEVVFCDPPYEMIDDPNRRGEFFSALEGLSDTWVRAGALEMLHHSPLPHALWPARRLECYDRRVYGRSQITLFRLAY